MGVFSFYLRVGKTFLSTMQNLSYKAKTDQFDYLKNYFGGFKKM